MYESGWRWAPNPWPTDQLSVQFIFEIEPVKLSIGCLLGDIFLGLLSSFVAALPIRLLGGMIFAQACGGDVTSALLDSSGGNLKSLKQGRNAAKELDPPGPKVGSIVGQVMDSITDQPAGQAPTSTALAN